MGYLPTSMAGMALLQRQAIHVITDGSRQDIRDAHDHSQHHHQATLRPVTACTCRHPSRAGDCACKRLRATHDATSGAPLSGVICTSKGGVGSAPLDCHTAPNALLSGVQGPGVAPPCIECVWLRHTISSRQLPNLPAMHDWVAELGSDESCQFCRVVIPGGQTLIQVADVKACIQCAGSPAAMQQIASQIIAPGLRA